MGSILHSPSLYVTLASIDFELAEEARRSGCRSCGGVLHRADYPRKPRCPIALDRSHHRRLSLCCATCRRRSTPRSVRFLGRRVYLGAVVVLATALAHGVTARRARTLREEFGFSRRTLERWRRWWRDAVPASGFWRVARARFLPPIAEDSLPASLVDRYVPDTVDGVSPLLRFLSPLSEGRS